MERDGRAAGYSFEVKIRNPFSKHSGFGMIERLPNQCLYGRFADGTIESARLMAEYSL